MTKNMILLHFRKQPMFHFFRYMATSPPPTMRELLISPYGINQRTSLTYPCVSGQGSQKNQTPMPMDRRSYPRWVPREYALVWATWAVRPRSAKEMAVVSAHEQARRSPTRSWTKILCAASSCSSRINCNSKPHLIHPRVATDLKSI